MPRGGFTRRSESIPAYAQARSVFLWNPGIAGASANDGAVFFRNAANTGYFVGIRITAADAWQIGDPTFQAAAGAGQNMSLIPQLGAAGSISGNFDVIVGAPVANVTAKLRLLESVGGNVVMDMGKVAGPFLSIRNSAVATASGIFIDVQSGVFIGRAQAGFTASIASNGGIQLDVGVTTAVWNAGGVATRTETLNGAGACTDQHSAGVTSITESQATQTSDAATANRILVTQAPFATATGTNRKPGDRIIDLNVPTNGGTDYATNRIRYGSSPKLYSDLKPGKVQTTDATVTTCGLYTLPDASISAVTATVEARRPSNGDSAAYVRMVGVKRHGGGGATLVGAVSATFTGEDAGAAAWDATLDVSGNDIRVRVTGAAGVTIEWTCFIQVDVNVP